VRKPLNPPKLKLRVELATECIQLINDKVFNLEAPNTAFCVPLAAGILSYAADLHSARTSAPDGGLLAMVGLAASESWPPAELIADLIANDSVDARAWLHAFTAGSAGIDEPGRALSHLLVATAACSPSEECRQSALTLIELHGAALLHRARQAGFHASSHGNRELQAFLLHVGAACVTTLQLASCHRRGVSSECEEALEV